MSLLLIDGLPNNHCAHTALWGGGSEYVQIAAQISSLNLYRGCWSEALRCFSGGWADAFLLSRLLQPAQTCLLSCCFSSSFQPPPHSPTSPLKKHLRQGRTRVFLILLGASRPQPGEHPDSRADWGRGGGGPGRRAASGQGCREEVPTWVGGGSPGLRARSRGLPRSGPEAPSYGRTREVSGQRGPGSYRVRSACHGGSRQGVFWMHFALGHPRPLPPALWGHWDGTKPSAANQRPHWSLSPEP